MSFEKKINLNSPKLFSATIANPKIKELAHKAEVPLPDNNKVAIYIKDIDDSNEGLMYNYLPTKEKSPFRYIDFHADFHTTVDRKSIEFDKNSAIGQYNSALLQACTELYFVVLNSYLPKENRVDLKINFIDIDSIDQELSDYNWEYLKLNKGYFVFYFVREILQISNYSYYLSSSFLSLLAKYYFYQQRNDSQYELFYQILNEFIEYFARDDGQEYKWINLFIKEVAKMLIKLEVNILPDIQFEVNKNILFRDKKENNIKLPDFLSINITNFDIKNKVFQEALGIKDYSDINILFKHFRQVSVNGEISDEIISEAQQKELLKSLFGLFKTKKEDVESFTYRYKSFFTQNDRRNYSDQNITAFSVSTIFLKTNNGKYKPAQLCTKYEIDEDFIKDISNDEEYSTFLNFIGVSSEKNYLVVDKIIYDKYKDGISIIPKVFPRDEGSNLTAKSIIPNIRIINTKNNKELHPALINYNRYIFFNDIQNKDLKKQLNYLRIGEYNSDKFPKEYIPLILKVLKENTLIYPGDVERFYSSNVFHLLANQDTYLITNENKLYWTSKTDFYIARNRDDYLLLKEQNINLLCFYNANEVPNNIKSKVIDLKLENVLLDEWEDITEKFKIEYEELVPFILAEKSYLSSYVSNKDYIKNVDDVNEFQDLWNKIKVIRGSNLKAELSYSNENSNIKVKKDYLFKDNTLYLNHPLPNNKKAQAIAKHIFDVDSLNAKIELVFFHKKKEELETEFNKEDIELIKSKWLPDYQKKYIKFQEEILSNYDYKLENDERWYVYDENHQSNFLIQISQNGKINELIELIKQKKLEKEYVEYFNSFELKIDCTHITKKISKLILLLEEKNIGQNFINRLNELSNKLGIEKDIDSIESKIYEKFPDLDDSNIEENKVSEKAKEIGLKKKIDNIYSKILTKDIKKIDTSGNSNNVNIPIKIKKIIYKGSVLPSSKNLEIIGSNGEEEVLIYFINHFLQIKEKEKRKAAIEAVYGLLKEKVGNDSLKVYKDECIKFIEDDEKLKKALIPLFYVTMHFKFSYFDLIVFFNGEPTLVEVKTTGRNKFYISTSEVNAARTNKNYMIVLNLSDSINILGNPIKDIESKITYIKGDKFALIPRNYEFILNE